MVFFMKIIVVFLISVCFTFAQDCDCVYNLARLVDSAECVNKNARFYDILKQVRHLNPITSDNSILIQAQGGYIRFAFDDKGWITTILRKLSANKSTYPIFKAECETIAETYVPYLTDQWKKSSRFYNDDCVVVLVQHFAKEKTVTTMYFFPKREE